MLQTLHVNTDFLSVKAWSIIICQAPCFEPLKHNKLNNLYDLPQRNQDIFMSLFPKYFEQLLCGGPCVWCNEYYSFFLIPFLKGYNPLTVTLQDIGCIPK